tara:strand:- start:584 stop:724 length:141 start_codon:yes stop_codon:yes gene_type:complete
MLFVFYFIKRSKMNKLRIGQLRAKPANSHAKLAGQEELKRSPLVLL